MCLFVCLHVFVSACVYACMRACATVHVIPLTLTNTWCQSVLVLLVRAIGNYHTKCRSLIQAAVFIGPQLLNQNSVSSTLYYQQCKALYAASLS